MATSSNSGAVDRTKGSVVWKQEARRRQLQDPQAEDVVTVTGDRWHETCGSMTGTGVVKAFDFGGPGTLGR